MPEKANRKPVSKAGSCSRFRRAARGVLPEEPHRRIGRPKFARIGQMLRINWMT
jgi:hypothetical protein